MPRIIPIRDLKDTAKISEMVHESDEPIFVTKNGCDEMAIINMNAYTDYEQAMRLMDVYKKLEAAEEDIREGRCVDAWESLKKIREKHGL